MFKLLILVCAFVIGLNVFNGMLDKLISKNTDYLKFGVD